MNIKREEKLNTLIDKVFGVMETFIEHKYYSLSELNTKLYCVTEDHVSSERDFFVVYLSVASKTLKKLARSQNGKIRKEAL